MVKTRYAPHRSAIQTINPRALPLRLTTVTCIDYIGKMNPYWRMFNALKLFPGFIYALCSWVKQEHTAEEIPVYSGCQTRIHGRVWFGPIFRLRRRRDCRCRALYRHYATHLGPMRQRRGSVQSHCRVDNFVIHYSRGLAWIIINSIITITNPLFMLAIFRYGRTKCGTIVSSAL